MRTFLIGLTAVLLVVVAAPARGAPWHPIRDDAGRAVRWPSCEIRYGYRGHQPASLTRAIRDASHASGVRFTRVGAGDGDLLIRRVRSNRGRYLAYSRWWTLGATITRAVVTVHPRAARRSEATRTNMFRHEIGHAMGLAHVRGDDVMNRIIEPHRSLSGWKSGLRSLYRRCSIVRSN